MRIYSRVSKRLWEVLYSKFLAYDTVMQVTGMINSMKKCIEYFAYTDYEATCKNKDIKYKVKTKEITAESFYFSLNLSSNFSMAQKSELISA